MLVANARMYSVTPVVKAAWQDLLAWVARTSGVPLTYLDHAAPAPLEHLWARDDLGAAFICGFPFASAARKPHILAAPVPSPPRYGGKPQYCTDLVVRADSAVTLLGDTVGGRIGWTVEHSQSGYQAVRHHFALRGAHDVQWVGPLVTPRRVIEAVLAGEIDIGPLDSYVHDLLRRHEPETAAKLRVVESTAMTPIPLLVASPGVERDAAARLRDALLACHREPALAATLETLLLARFDAVEPGDYDVLLRRAQAADRAGISARHMAPGRLRVLGDLATTVAALSPGRPLRIAIDGRTAAGKTTLANELAALIRALGRPVIRTSVDGFHRPKAERYARGRRSAEGYYRDARDLQAVMTLLLDPLGPRGDRLYRTASFDLDNDRPIEQAPVLAHADAILIVNGTFLQRPELREGFDLAIFVETSEAVAEHRAVGRDAAQAGGADAVKALYAERYGGAFDLYESLCMPGSIADIVLNNDDLGRPTVLIRTGGRAA